jgi:hypothetical protein
VGHPFVVRIDEDVPVVVILEPTDRIGDGPVRIRLAPSRQVVVGRGGAPVEAPDQHDHPALVGGFDDLAQPCGVGGIQRTVRAIALDVAKSRAHDEDAYRVDTVGLERVQVVDQLAGLGV